MAKTDRPFRALFVGFTEDDRYRSLSFAARALWAEIVQGPFSTSIPGVAKAGPMGLAESVGMSADEFSAAWAELEAKSGARADWGARLVWIPFVRVFSLPPFSPGQKTNWRRVLAELRPCALADALRAAWRDALGGPEAPTPEPERPPLLAAAERAETHRETHPETHRETHRETHPETHPETVSRPIPDKEEEEEEVQDLTAPAARLTRARLDAEDLRRLELHDQAIRIEARSPPSFRRLCGIAQAVIDAEPEIGIADLTAETKSRAARQGVAYGREPGGRALVARAVDAVLHARGRRCPTTAPLDLTRGMSSSLRGP